MGLDVASTKFNLEKCITVKLQIIKDDLEIGSIDRKIYGEYDIRG